MWVCVDISLVATALLCRIQSPQLAVPHVAKQGSWAHLSCTKSSLGTSLVFAPRSVNRITKICNPRLRAGVAALEVRAQPPNVLTRVMKLCLI